jgi:hypothetical protein
MGIRVRYQVKDVDGIRNVEEIHKVVVHRFRLSDVDDPDIYAAQPIWEWQQTDAGKFIIENSVTEPAYHQYTDATHMGYSYAITAELEKKKLAEFYLRWGRVDGNY